MVHLRLRPHSRSPRISRPVVWTRQPFGEAEVEWFTYVFALIHDLLEYRGR